jgi:hypothetical protein
VLRSINTMPFDHFIDPSRRRVVVSAQGTPDLSDVLEIIRRIRNELRVILGRVGVLALIEGMEYFPSPGELDIIANQLADCERAQSGGVALVVAQPGHLALASMLACTTPSVAAFSSRTEAEAWLDQWHDTNPSG